MSKLVIYILSIVIFFSCSLIFDYLKRKRVSSGEEEVGEVESEEEEEEDYS